LERLAALHVNLLIQKKTADDDDDEVMKVQRPETYFSIVFAEIRHGWGTKYIMIS